MDIIFDEVIIPKAVYNEIVIKGAGKPGCDELREVKFIKVYDVNNLTTKSSIMLELDEGEAEVIALALEQSIDTIIVDEFAGREYARLMRLNVIGTLGILIKAKQLKIINKIRPLMDELIKNRRYIDKDLYNLVLELSSEHS